MASIKTKSAVKETIKTVDKTLNAAQRAKIITEKLKDKAEQSSGISQQSENEYASDKYKSGIKSIANGTICTLDKTGHKAFDDTKNNIYKAKNQIQRFRERKAQSSINNSIKTVSKTTEKTIKETGKNTIKTANNTVKATQKAAKTTVNTTKQTAKAAQKTAKASAKAAQKSAQAAKTTAKATAKAIKIVVKAIISATKILIAGTKALISAIIAGGWIAVIIIIVICLIGLIVDSAYGVFLSGEDTGNGMTMQTAVQEINTDYTKKLEETKASSKYDKLEMSGSIAVWKDVLSVYAVKTVTDPDNPQEVASMDNAKKNLLKEIFWEMNSISSKTQKKTETVIIESDDGHGNIVQKKKKVTYNYLYITVSHKTADEMADKYGFDDEQKMYLDELLAEENNSMWSAVLYGISDGNGEITSVALSQIGNIGGQPYWSWYGFNSRVEWCACFVSWCANECGYIETGVIPKFASCSVGIEWFKSRGQWADNSYVPTAGQIVFFDWEGDGVADHVGIVEKCENSIVYTVEGNSGDSCQAMRYPVGSNNIFGYGLPAF